MELTKITLKLKHLQRYLYKEGDELNEYRNITKIEKILKKMVKIY